MSDCARSHRPTRTQVVPSIHDPFRSTRTVHDGPPHASYRRRSRPADRPTRLTSSPLRGEVLDKRAEAVLGQIAGIRRFARNGFVAPNKPLTLLWALGRVEQGEPRLTPYATAERELQPLLDVYGTPGTSPVHAFWRLQNDGVWEVVASEELVPSSPSKEPPLAAMRAHASGGFTTALYDALLASQALREAVGEQLLAQLRNTVASGIYVPRASRPREAVNRLRRHAAFRVGVMTQFEARCAVCDWRLAQRGKPVGLVSAHVHPLERDGPDAPGNGFVLCWLHHAVFDAGLFTYDERRLIVAGAWQEDARGSMPSLRDYAGKALPEPKDPRWRVHDAHLAWHRAHIFRGR